MGGEMKIKTSELTGTAIDWAVARCEGFEIDLITTGKRICVRNYEHEPFWVFCPSTSWEHGGQIIEHEGISLIRCDDDYKTDKQGFTTNKRIPVWAAEHGGGHSKQSSYEGECYPPQFEITASGCWYGLTPLIAAMRCYVASKLGAEIEVPEQLTTEGD